MASALPPGHLRVIQSVLTMAMVSLDSYTGGSVAVPPLPHRADYILERGVWRVSCRVCGWKASDPMRRQLASRFRFHVQMQPDGTRSEER